MNTFYDYMPYMAGGGNFQQAPAQQQASSQDETIMQYIQAYAQMSKTDPQQIMQQLQKMKPAEQKKALAQIIKAVDSAMQQQQQGQQQMSGQPAEAPEESGMAYGGTTKKKKGSTFSGNLWYEQGGYVPSYAEYAYGGYHSEIPALFNQQPDRPNKAMYGMGMAQGGQMPQWLAERRFRAAGNEDMMSQYGYKMGGQPCYECGGKYLGGGPFDGTNELGRYSENPNLMGDLKPGSRKNKNAISLPVGFQNGSYSKTPYLEHIPMPAPQYKPGRKYRDIDPGMGISPSKMRVGYNPDPGMTITPTGIPRNYNPDPYFAIGANLEKGGIVVGQEMDATPEMLQKLREGGYTFEFID